VKNLKLMGKESVSGSILEMVMKNPSEVLTQAELDGEPTPERSWVGEYICIDCISEVSLGYSLGWTKHREHCLRCYHKTTLYEAQEQRHL
jgi:hypothetical protein